MSRTQTWFLLPLLAAISARADVLNGGFEISSLGPSAFLNIAPGSEPGGFGWSVVVNNVDLFSVGVLGTTAPTVDGTQALDLVGFGSTGAISQSFATTVGQSYRLIFWYANNPVSVGSASASVTVMDGLTSLLSQSVTHSGSTGSDFGWTQFNQIFTASGTSATLSFTNTLGGSNGGVFLDAVSVTPVASSVPEPSTFALGGIALGGLAIAARAKRSRG